MLFHIELDPCSGEDVIDCPSNSHCMEDGSCSIYCACDEGYRRDLMDLCTGEREHIHYIEL